METQRFQQAPGFVGETNSGLLRRTPHSIGSRNKILSSLSESALARLTPHLQLVSYKTGEDIIRAGQLIEFVYFPETLVVSELCYMKDGSRAATSITGHDGALGVTALLSQPRARYWAIASVGGTARRIRVRSLQAEYGGSPGLQGLVLAYVSDCLFQLAQKSVCSMLHHLEERLCSLLLTVLDRTVSPILPVTHESIAEHLGVRRAGVTTYFNTLRALGIVSTKRGQLTILDRNRLETFACECYRRIDINSAGGRIEAIQHHHR